MVDNDFALPLLAMHECLEYFWPLLPMSFFVINQIGMVTSFGNIHSISTVPVGPEVSSGMDGFLDSHVELETLVG